MLRRILHELRTHAPFTLLGTAVGAVATVLFVYTGIPHKVSFGLFGAFHPLHVFFSAVVTAAMFRLHHRRNILALIIIGFVGSVGIGTLSDSLMPYAGEWLLGLHDPHVHAHAHIGFIELWYLVNPLALGGIAFAHFFPYTRLPHAGHVLLSTAASLFHMLMSVAEGGAGVLTLVMMPVFLFLAVWVPCCTSDIVFPLLFCRDAREGRTCSLRAHDHAHEAPAEPQVGPAADEAP